MKLLFHTKTLDIFWRITWGCFPRLCSLMHVPLQEVVCILLEILHVIKERVLPGKTTEEAEYVIPSCWQCKLLNSHISTVTAYWELGGSRFAADYIRRLCFYVDDLWVMCTEFIVQGCRARLKMAYSWNYMINVIFFFNRNNYTKRCHITTGLHRTFHADIQVIITSSVGT